MIIIIIIVIIVIIIIVINNNNNNNININNNNNENNNNNNHNNNNNNKLNECKSHLISPDFTPEKLVFSSRHSSRAATPNAVNNNNNKYKAPKINKGCLVETIDKYHTSVAKLFSFGQYLNLCTFTTLLGVVHTSSRSSAINIILGSHCDK